MTVLSMEQLQQLFSGDFLSFFVVISEPKVHIYIINSKQQREFEFVLHLIVSLTQLLYLDRCFCFIAYN
jgi:hypothetical protein